MRIHLTVSMLVTAALVSSASPPETPPTPKADTLKAFLPPVIRFPSEKSPTPVAPTTTLIGNAKIKLDAECWYIIDFDEELVVDQISKDDKGSVTVSPKKGPLTIPSKMAPGREADADDPDLVTIKGPFIYIVKAKTTGDVILEVIQPVRKDREGKALPFTRDNITRKTLDVLAEQGPRPPPDVNPVEPVVPPGPVTSFRVIFGFESGKNLTGPQLGAAYAKEVEEYLKANTTPEGGLAGFRRYDVDTEVKNEQPTMKALWEAVKSQITTTPCLIIEVNGKATILPYPKDAADSLATLKKYRTGGNK
jgi:hypothetical protein